MAALAWHVDRILLPSAVTGTSSKTSRHQGLKTLHLNNVVHRDVKLGPGAWKKGDQLEAIKRNDKKEKEERSSRRPSRSN